MGGQRARPERAGAAWRFAAGLAVAGLGVLAGAAPAFAGAAAGGGGQAPTPEPATLSAQPEPGAGGEKLDFGEDRGTKRLEIAFVASAPLAEPPQVEVTQPHSGEGQVFAGTVTAAAAKSSPSGKRAVRVSLLVDADKAAPGEYGARLLLRGDGVAEASVPVTIKLAAQGWKPLWAWVVAIACLGVGLGLGLLAKWLSDTGTKLQQVRARLGILQVALSGAKVPEAVRIQLREVREFLADGDAEAAEAKLKPVEEHRGDLTRLSAAVAAIEEALRHQGELAKQVCASAKEQFPDLPQIVELERQELSRLLEAAWPDPGTGVGSLEKLTKEIFGFGALLGRLQDETFAKQAGLPEVVSLYEAREFDKAEEKRQALSGGPSGNLALESELGRRKDEVYNTLVAVSPFQPRSSRAPRGRCKHRLPSVKQAMAWLARHAALLLQAILGLALLAVGLVTAFQPETMFHGNAGGDIIALFSWGFASGLAGATVASVTGKLPSGSSAG